MTAPLLAASAHPSARLRVLLVDDEEAVCRSLGRGLERLGFEVTVARSGTEALTALERSTFDAIVTDQQMPGMTGPELIAMILARDPTLRHRLVITGGDLGTIAARELVAATGCRAIEKPFHLLELAAAVRDSAQGVRSAR
jgi:CheY-like chemotaxis protein